MFPSLNILVGPRPHHRPPAPPWPAQQPSSASPIIHTDSNCTTIFTFFEKVKIPNPLMDAKLNYERHFKSSFSIFRAVSCVFGLASKFAKSVYMTHNFFLSHNNRIWVSKNAEYDADFKFVEKGGKKVIGLRTFVHSNRK
jgi:hypothetical protein